MAATGVSTATVLRDGLQWRVPVGDPHVGFGLFVEGGFEREKIDTLLAWLDRRGRAPGAADVIIDVGANIGSTCIPVVRARGCHAVAIEPVPGTSALLRQNVELNGLSESIRVIEAAVVTVSGPVLMEVSDNIGAAAVNPVESATSISVAGAPLSELLAEAGVQTAAVSLVWADVQGCETAAIETGADLWARGVPLWAEFEPALLARHGGVTRFIDAAHRNFDRFIEAHDLLASGAATRPEPISRLAGVLSRELIQTDVLLLPPAFPA